MTTFHDKPPWQVNIDTHTDQDKVEVQTEAAQEIRKKELARGGKWAKWEKGRQKALRERRDYFKANPDKKDDFSGV